MIAKTIKAPAGFWNIEISYPLGIILNSKAGMKVKIFPKEKAPVPNISLKNAITIIAIVYPAPIPKASINESNEEEEYKKFIDNLLNPIDNDELKIDLSNIDKEELETILKTLNITEEELKNMISKLHV